MAEKPIISPERGWVCVAPAGKKTPAWVAGFTYKRRRDQSQASIAEFFAKEGETTQQGWKRAYRRGYRCARAVISVELTRGSGT